jgi:hypothetical protein
MMSVYHSDKSCTIFTFKSENPQNIIFDYFYSLLE